ncbi:transglutaminase domain-containing protein [Bacteroides fragilis]|nr:transglutaminase domain-containing protein [Bacteroides fragilis]MCS2881142.1 transglutaminase domain-containing protein [Bacteroides fragilis]
MKHSMIGVSGKKKIVMKTYLLCGLLGAVVCCSCTENKRLKYALEFAGENRGELEKVLEHYKDSGLKQDAARFLIENMPRYFSYEGWQLDTLKAIHAATVHTDGWVNKEARKKWEHFSYRTLKRVYDAKVIRAEFLIHHIDQAFEVWEKRPWNKYLPFDDFCELILPYRVGDEPLEEWRSWYKERYESILDSLYQGTDVVEATDCLGAYLRQEKDFRYSVELELPHLGAGFLLSNRVGSCEASCDFTVYVLRALGIPAATDIYHYGPGKGAGHVWNVLRDTTGGYVPFWFIQTKVERGGNDKREKGKVYRQCFGAQREKISGIRRDRSVPFPLKDPYLKDVTDDYFPANQVEIEIDSQVNKKYICLGVFTLEGCMPIDITLQKGNKATFTNVEPGILFQPLYFNGLKWVAAGYPFLVDEKGEVKYHKPDFSKKESMDLNRKFLLRQYLKDYLSAVVGSKIEGANHLDFSDACLLYQIVDTPKVSYQAAYPPSEKKYRYIRYTSPPDKPLQLAELQLFRSSDDQEKLSAKVVGGSNTFIADDRFDSLKVNDGDGLTFFLTKEKGAFVTLDLGKAEKIGKIVYMPRNDDNFIRLGDQYELYYQDGFNGWISLGKQVATELTLHYDNIPQNAVLWLRNLSRGKEETVFRNEAGRQVFFVKW